MDECSWINPPSYNNSMVIFTAKPSNADIFCAFCSALHKFPGQKLTPVISMRETIGMDFEKSRDKEKKNIPSIV
ncbi:MAG: hypothetical protein D3907_07860 [Candidatus Electrothrix sp. AUS3]|nr:hypothetical protein [Candidatus Electrothrix gigas]